MRFHRNAVIALAIGGSATYWACTSKTTDDYSTKNILVADGQTCGDIENAPSGPIVAGCESGVDCALMLDSFPDGGIGLRIGICAEKFGSCGDASAPCPNGTDCEDLVLPDRSFAACLTPCKTADDCPAPFQLCDFDHCQPLPCATDVDCQNQGTCSDHLCVRGDASTR